MLRLLQSTVDGWNKNEDAKVAIFLGAGTKAFCAGGDIRSLYHAKKSGESSVLRDYFWHEYILDYTISTMKPVQVVIYNGIVMGGGVGISIHAPIRIATEASVFAMPETAIGFFPDVGGSFFLPRLQQGMGLFLGLTGTRLTGQQLVSAGIATHFLPSGEIKHLKEMLRKKINAHSTLEDVRHIVKEIATPVLEPVQSIDLIQKHFHNATSVDQIVSNLESDPSEWAQQNLASLKNVSQLSLKVTFEQLKRGANLSLPQCFTQEFRLTQNFVRGHDFFEGVRAKVVEKNAKPKWQYPTIAEVPDSVVQGYFEKATPEQEDLFVDKRCQ